MKEHVMGGKTGGQWIGMGNLLKGPCVVSDAITKATREYTLNGMRSDMYGRVFIQRNGEGKCIHENKHGALRRPRRHPSIPHSARLRRAHEIVDQ